ncbi:MAG: DUF447 family protein [Planctomycetes bacterium]|nr:DUF447 family protein [Planctomycetota bacterium]
MILEGIVTTKNTDGSFNVAPMGPRVDESFTTLILRPFQTSQTYRNLKEHSSGVFHVTDDVHLLARAAIGSLNALPETFPAETIDGVVLTSACRWYEFKIESFDDLEERTTLTAKVVHSGRIRDFFGFNRAKHAVVEAAILATRMHLLPRQDILDQFATLKVIVEKTAGPREVEAFELLERYVTENDGNQ